MISKNLRQAKWDADYSTLHAGRVLASDISKVLAGKQFQPITMFLSPNPRLSKQRSIKEIERTLMTWASLED